MADKILRGKVELNLEDLKKARDQTKLLEEELKLRKAPERLKAVQDEIAKIGEGSKSASQQIKESFTGAISTVVAGFTALRIKSFLDNSVQEFNKLEKTLLGLQATAKLTGNNFDKLKGSVQKLSTDGVLSIDQAATSMKTLLAQGIKADQAFSLLDAAKKVGAFNNIVGDTGQAVADFVKFLQTGSAELAENLDPSIVKVVKSLGGYEKVASDAGAKQKLINAVIEKGGKLTGDYEKFLQSGAQAQVAFNKSTEALSQTVGGKLQPAYNAFFVIGTKVVTMVTEFISKIDGTAVTLGALAVVLGIVSQAATAAGVRIGIAWLAALGPIGLIVAAFGAVLAALIALNRYSKADALIESYKQGGKELAELTKKAKELEAQNKKSKESENELLAIREKLRDKARELGQDYDKLAKTYKNAGDMAQYLTEAERNINREKAAQEVTKEIKKLDDEIAERKAGKGNVKRVVKALYTAGISEALRDSDKELEEKRQKRVEQFVDLYQPKAETNQPAVPLATGGTAPPEFRFIQARDELRKLRGEYDAYIRKVGKDTAEGAEATRKFGLDQQNVVANLRQNVAQFIEEKAMAETEALRVGLNQARANIEEIYNAEVERIEKSGMHEIDMAEEVYQARKKRDEQLAKAKQMALIKEKQIQLQSIADNLSGANATLSGINQLRNAKDAGSVLSGFGATTSGLSGLKGLLPSLSVLGPAGAALGAAGGIVSTLTSIFGKSDAERAREAADAQREQEEQKKLLEIQAEYQKRLVSIQEANTKLPFENLQRQLRLVDIKAQQEQLAGVDAATVENNRLAARSQAIQATISSQAGTIGQGSIFSGFQATPESLTALLNQAGAYGPSTEAFLSYAQQALGDVGSIQQLSTLRQQMESLTGSVPKEIYEEALNFVRAKEANFWKVYNQMHQGDYNLASSKQFRDEFLGQALSTNYAITGSVSKFWSTVGTRASGSTVLANLNARGAEFKNDITTAENLISVIEQGNSVQLEIARNTAATAKNTEVPKDNALSFVNIGKGFTQSLGMVNAGVNSNAIQAPAGLGNVILATQKFQEVTDSNLTRLDKQIELQALMVQLLGKIADGGFGGSSNIDQVRTQLVAILGDAKYRKVA